MRAYEQLLHPTVQKSAQQRLNPGQIVYGVLGPFRLISKIWSCWHRRMSRPFTRDGETYRVCLRCGVHRRFDLQAWKMKGAYYRDKKVVIAEVPETSAVSTRAKLRLIA
ncbi:MAG TPA: hypothetical protein VFS77_22800 [Pyrinomonadaceae bacterium]|nr:hypothetical protein [Pyrinomonadaceae bacterium]